MTSYHGVARCPLVLAVAAGFAGWLIGRAGSAPDRDHLRWRLRHDPLTGALSRTGWACGANLRVAELWRAGHSVAVGMVDIDRFKQWNDTLGHAAGDAVLGLVADRLCQAVGPLGLVARYGGDEFTALVPALSAAGWWLDEEERLRERLSRPALLAGVARELSVSVGLTPAYPGVDLDACLARADARMYANKRGRGRGDQCGRSVASVSRPRPNDQPAPGDCSPRMEMALASAA